ncbi:MAG: hypothetical protein K2N06_06600 [Oscillospiraceae bacterium]|nr:hypothetical protein [Oscillospiraceae bacterium]
MTRDEIRKLFPEATDEQISTLLSSHHNELNKLKDDNKSLKEKADKFDAAEREKLSQEEKLNALIEEANKAKAENLRLLNRTKAAAKLTALGLSEEEYSPILDGFVSDNEEQTLNFAIIYNRIMRCCFSSRVNSAQPISFYQSKITFNVSRGKNYNEINEVKYSAISRG